MSFLWNLILITAIAATIIFYLYYLLKRKETEEEDVLHNPYDLNYLTECIKESFNQILNTNISEMNLKKEALAKREKLRAGLKKALRTCSYGNVGEKEYVKDYIKVLLQQKYHIDHENIERVIPFSKRDELSVNDKFDILLYMYKKEYGPLAMENLVEAYHLDEGKQTEEGLNYEITCEDILKIYEMEQQELSYPDKMNLLAQKIYQSYKGHGAIDELRDMRIDGISGGVSGMANEPYNYLEEIMREQPSNLRSNYESIWMFYHGKTIHLSFLGFETQRELERICKNIYRFNHPGQLSAANGYKVNDLYDGARVVVVRPPFAESWAFFLRKFDTAPNANIYELVTDKGAEDAIELMRWMIKGCQVIGVTGEQGCGKTTLLKALIRFIDPTYTLRIQELVFETHLRRIYPKRNIITFQETAEVSGQEALDLQKKTDGVVNILGEVASAPVASWVVQLSQVGTKMTMFTNHAMTTQKMIGYFRNALLSVNQFHNEKIAEEQVVEAINFDIHMMKDRNGKRYIERITEIIPNTTEYHMENFSLRTGIQKFLNYTMNQHSYELKDLLVYQEGKYVLQNPISEWKIEQICKNLSEQEEAEFLSFLKRMNHECEEVGRERVRREREVVSGREPLSNTVDPFWGMKKMEIRRNCNEV